MAKRLPEIQGIKDDDKSTNDAYKKPYEIAKKICDFLSEQTDEILKTI